MPVGHDWRTQRRADVGENELVCDAARLIGHERNGPALGHGLAHDGHSELLGTAWIELSFIEEDHVGLFASQERSSGLLRGFEDRRLGRRRCDGSTASE